MTQRAKDFAKFLSTRPEIANNLGIQVENSDNKIQIFIEIAKEHGFELTDEDFTTEAKELSKEELAAVAGGGDCICVVGGGGTQTEAYPENSPACACVLYGQGNDMHGMPRCICITGGSGSEWFPY